MSRYGGPTFSSSSSTSARRDPETTMALIQELTQYINAANQHTLTDIKKEIMRDIESRDNDATSTIRLMNNTTGLEIEGVEPTNIKSVLSINGVKIKEKIAGFISGASSGRTSGLTPPSNDEINNFAIQLQLFLTSRALFVQTVNTIEETRRASVGGSRRRRRNRRRRRTRR